MTSELVQAITNYARKSNFLRREVGMALIRDGHLSRLEEDRLFEVLRERIAQRGRARMAR